MFGCRQQHPHFFPGDIGGRLQADLAAHFLEPDRDIAIHEQGAADVELGPRADFKTANWNIESVGDDP